MSDVIPASCLIQFEFKLTPNVKLELINKHGRVIYQTKESNGAVEFLESNMEVYSQVYSSSAKILTTPCGEEEMTLDGWFARNSEYNMIFLTLSLHI